MDSVSEFERQHTQQVAELKPAAAATPGSGLAPVVAMTPHNQVRVWFARGFVTGEVRGGRRGGGDVAGR
jgi:hypothetical protein